LKKKVVKKKPTPTAATATGVIPGLEDLFDTSVAQGARAQPQQQAPSTGFDPFASDEGQNPFETGGAVADLGDGFDQFDNVATTQHAAPASTSSLHSVQSTSSSYQPRGHQQQPQQHQPQFAVDPFATAAAAKQPTNAFDIF